MYLLFYVFALCEEDMLNKKRAAQKVKLGIGQIKGNRKNTLLFPSYACL